MRLFNKFIQTLLLIAMVAVINIPSAFATKPMTHNEHLQKKFSDCLLEGGQTRIPKTGKGAICCPPNGYCIKCVGSFCRQAYPNEIADSTPEHMNRKSESVSSGKVMAPNKETPRKPIKQRSLESKGVIAPRNK
ncbi:MAG: hypothetical protein OQL27_01310 [Sedimenticola sp.]|nr:hypothetical protein [Sedimenticola sp.]